MVENYNKTTTSIHHDQRCGMTILVRIIAQLNEATRYPFCCSSPFLNSFCTGVFSLWDLWQQISRLRKLRFFIQEQEVDSIQRWFNPIPHALFMDKLSQPFSVAEKAWQVTIAIISQGSYLAIYQDRASIVVFFEPFANLHILFMSRPVRVDRHFFDWEAIS